MGLASTLKTGGTASQFLRAGGQVDFDVWSDSRDRSWGRIEVAGVQHRLDALVSLFDRPLDGEGRTAESTAVLRREPSNPHDANAVQVLCDGKMIGYLRRGDAQRYNRAIRVMEDVGLTPRVPLKLWGYMDWRWDEDVEDQVLRPYCTARLCLPEPHLLGPAVGPPRTTFVMLPLGNAIKAKLNDDALRALAPVLAGAPDRWIFVSVGKIVPAGRTKPYVEIRYAGQPVGRLTPQMSGELFPVIDSIESTGAAAVCRAVVAGNDLQVTLFVHTARAHQLPAGWRPYPTIADADHEAVRTLAGGPDGLLLPYHEQHEEHTVTDPSGVVDLRPGQAVDLSTAGTAREVVAVEVSCRPHDGTSVELSALLLTSDRVISEDNDFVFYNNQNHRSGCLSVSPATAARPEACVFTSSIDLAAVPGHLSSAVFIISADDGRGASARPGPSDIRVKVRAPNTAYSLHVASEETLPATILVEIYRRRSTGNDSQWRLRAVAQGWQDGLAGLVREHGIAVDA
jgi:stress response protein SCP2